jgi:hypothetical protein
LVARRRTRRRSLRAYPAAVSTAAQLCPRHSCERRTCQRWTIPCPARPDSGNDEQAAHRPQRHVEPGARGGLPRPTDVFRIQHAADSWDAEAADTGRLSVRTPGSHRSRGHRSPGHRSPGHRSPGHRTSARAVGWTDVRTADSGRGPSDERRGRRPDILDGHDGWAAQTSLGLQRLRRSATHDSSAVTPPAAAVTGSCAAPLDKPRLGALLSCVGVGGYEGRAMGLRKGEGVQGWSGEAVLMGVADESWERAGLWMRM